MLKFNVFGKVMSVHRRQNEWQLFLESDVGMRSRVYDVVIPVELTESEIASYLDDIYHEMATEKYQRVVQISE